MKQRQNIHLGEGGSDAEERTLFKRPQRAASRAPGHFIRQEQNFISFSPRDASKPVILRPPEGSELFLSISSESLHGEDH